MRETREDIIQRYRQWLEQFSWSWFCTLKITSGVPSMRRAKQMLDQWITELRGAEGGGDFRWFRVLERGFDGGNIHFHVLIGGFRNRKTFWEQKWNGDAVITRYDPSQNGIFYLLKDMADDGDLNFDCDLPKTNSRDAVDDELQENKVTPASILVEGIDGRTSPSELKKLFKPYGRILETAILESRVDVDRTLITVTITFQNSFAATRAVDGRDGIWLRGRPLRVSLWGTDQGFGLLPKSERA